MFGINNFGVVCVRKPPTHPKLPNYLETITEYLEPMTPIQLQPNTISPTVTTSALALANTHTHTQSEDSVKETIDDFESIKRERKAIRDWALRMGKKLSQQ